MQRLYIYIHIYKNSENNINNILCPDLSCNFNIIFNEIKKFCPKSFSRYENMLLNVTLRNMKDIIFCPRISCQYPLVKNNDDTLVKCSKYDHIFCYKV